MATIQKYPPLKKPILQGHYFIAESGEKPHLVQVCIENDTNDMHVILPNEAYKYHIGMWDGLWFGPVDKDDFDMFGN